MPNACSTPISSAARYAPAQAAQPADHDDHEGLGDDATDPCCRLADPRGSCSAPPSPASAGAEREHRGEQHALVDAERAHHLAVLRRRAHQRAPARAVQQQPQRAQHQPARPRSAAGRRRETARRRCATNAAQSRRARREQVLRPPDRQRHVLHDQHHAEGREQLEQLRRAVDAPQQHHLDHHAERRQRPAPPPTTPPQKPSGVARQMRVSSVQAT